MDGGSRRASNIGEGLCSVPCVLLSDVASTKLPFRRRLHAPAKDGSGLSAKAPNVGGAMPRAVVVPAEPRASSKGRANSRETSPA